MKSGWKLIINSFSLEQIESGFWFYNLIPDAMHKIRLKVISLSELNNLLKDCGFSNTVQEVNMELIIQSNDYFTFKTSSMLTGKKEIPYGV